MEINKTQQDLLKQLPGVDYILEITKAHSVFDGAPRSVLVRCIRETLDDLRRKVFNRNIEIDSSDLSDGAILPILEQNVARAMQLNLRRVVNATGVVVHTNLGRSLLAEEAVSNLEAVGRYYSNLEFNLETGKRGLRYTNVEDILCEISGAASAMVVNNNAGAVLLSLETIARGKEVIVSRGELVEIGGAFRIPDVMLKSGCILKEVGTTNRTHFRDYENAIDDNTGLLLKVHKSNYSIVGFTAEISLNEVVDLGKNYNVPVMEDLGSGTFIDFSKYGLVKEPTVQESVAAGADIVTFSGDKLLGGPQAGIIVGKKEFLDQIKKNPMTRALRIDRLTLAALESTLRLYRDEKKAVESIPTLRMITASVETIEKKARRLERLLKDFKEPRLETAILNLSSKSGGGALPLLELPSRCVGVRISGMSANTIEKRMRNFTPPIIGRIEDDFFIFDPRTLLDDELIIIQSAFAALLEKAVP